jgi:hypothetical protein
MGGGRGNELKVKLIGRIWGFLEYLCSHRESKDIFTSNYLTHVLEMIDRRTHSALSSSPDSPSLAIHVTRDERSLSIGEVPTDPWRKGCSVPFGGTGTRDIG